MRVKRKGKKKSCAHLSLSLVEIEFLFRPFSRASRAQFETGCSSGRQLSRETHLLGGKGPAVAPHSKRERESLSQSSFLSSRSVVVESSSASASASASNESNALCLALCLLLAAAFLELRWRDEQAPRRSREGGSTCYPNERSEMPLLLLPSFGGKKKQRERE